MQKHWSSLDASKLEFEFGGHGLTCPNLHHTDELQGEQGPPVQRAELVPHTESEQIGTRSLHTHILASFPQENKGRLPASGRSLPLGPEYPSEQTQLIREFEA